MPDAPTGWAEVSRATAGGSYGIAAVFERVGGSDGSSADTPTFALDDPHAGQWHVILGRVTGSDDSEPVIIAGRDTGSNTGADTLWHESVTAPVDETLVALFGGGYTTETGTYSCLAPHADLQFLFTNQPSTSMYVGVKEVVAGATGVFDVRCTTGLFRHAVFTLAFLPTGDGPPPDPDPTFKPFWAENTTLVIQ